VASGGNGRTAKNHHVPCQKHVPGHVIRVMKELDMIECRQLEGSSTTEQASESDVL